MNNRVEYLRHQIEAAEIHGDTKHATQCERELRSLNKCYGCQYLVVDTIASTNGDGYGSSYEHCDPPMGQCPMEC